MTAPETCENGHLPEALTESMRDAVLTTFESFFEEAPGYLGTTGPEMLEDGIVGIISFVGDLPWTMMLGLPRPTAAAVALAFVGCEVEFESGDMGDVVGEMANIIAGDVVARLDEAGLTVEMGIPAVTRGHDMEMLSPEGTPGVRLQFELPAGPFWTEVVVPEGHKEASSRPKCAVCGR
ncbi:MAG TPA: chemotaxis protein CheX [Armatimonadota bacterium]|jgi:CheY-specific phosphatase CheX